MTIHPERERLEPLQAKLLKVDRDPLAINRYAVPLNPDGPEAWREIEALIDRLEKAEAELTRYQYDDEVSDEQIASIEKMVAPAIEAAFAPTDEQVERVARALCKQAGYDPAGKWGSIRLLWQRWIPEAHVAIKAMKP